MLAGRAPERPDFTRAKYADNAVEDMLESMKDAGAETRRITAVIVGGAHMFQESGDTRPSIGQRNLEGVRAALKRYNIRITEEDTGGDYGRTVEVSVDTGKVVVKSFRRGVKILHE